MTRSDIHRVAELTEAEAIMIIKTAEGTIKWYASKVVEVERGSKISFTATVKAHEIYQERITTVVNRPTKIVIG